MKLSQHAIERLREGVDWKSPAAHTTIEQRFRELAYQYVTNYMARGNDGLAVYRDAARPTAVAAEFKTMIDSMPEMTTFLPELRHYLLEYPRAKLANATDFFYWQDADFGLKPTIRINHVVIRQDAGRTVAASKMLYASHYFWAAIELRALVPDPTRGPGFWFVTVNRSRSDGLDGFLGRIIRGRVRSEVEKGVSASLKATKVKMEF